MQNKLRSTLLGILAIMPMMAWAAFPNNRVFMGVVPEGTVVDLNCSFLNYRYPGLQVTGAEADCGLEIVDFTRNPISLYETGAVTVRFRSQGRPGRVRKAIRLQTIGGEEVGGYIEVYGRVEDAANQSAVVYKDTIGGLAFDHVTEMAGQLKSDADREFTFRVKNVSKAVINLTDKVESKPAFQLVMGTKSLKPGQEAVLTVKFLGKNGDASGFKKTQGLFEPIVFYTDEAEKNRKTLIINGSYERIYTAQELAEAPQAAFELTDYQAGDILQGQYLTYNFRLTNKGKRDLVIESVKASCGCTATEPKEKVVKGGGTTEITARFDSNGKQGPQHKTITVTTNDPQNPVIILHLRCNILTDPFSNPDSGSGDNPYGEGHYPGDGHNH